ncbi:hypothetical protein [Bradyrhizobium sp. 149]|uniref:hypothetical protein n=1 Tax=Bradyrhizobium sp. 149 TaxID=2782624 RepID=UPI001FFB0D99|nr:hypothetical protein [Bradyrhizobium sp. 149]
MRARLAPLMMRLYAEPIRARTTVDRGIEDDGLPMHGDAIDDYLAKERQRLDGTRVVV